MRARVVAVFLVCCWVFLVDPICAKPNPYGWSHIHLVDHFSDKDGFTNLLFRTGIPDNATNQFAYDDLAREFRKHADDAHVPFPDDYDLVDLCLLTSEIDDIKLEHDWYVAHPDLGTFQWWPLEGVSRETVEEGCRTVGIPPDRCPSEQPKDFTDADKKLLSLKFNTWTPDRLEEKLDRTHTMIHTRGKKPVIVFGHCECGCDRTGDFFGAYMIRYLGLSYVEAMKINESIPQRHIGYTHQVSIQWYCNKLRYQGDYRGNDCDDCEDFRCSDSVEGPRVTSWVAGAVATILTSPLEVVKTRMQGTGNFVGHVRAMTTPSVSEGWMRSFAHSSDTLASIRHVLHVEGWHGLFRGLGPNLSGVAPARAIYFAVYSETKSLLSRRWGDTAATHVVAATAAGWATATSLNPVWLIKTRLQLQGGGIHGMSSSGYKNSFDCVRRVYREEGLRGLWSGVTASYWGTSETVLYFLMYERMKSWIARKAHKEKEDVGPIELFALSGISKLVATVATYPHEVARTRLREQRSQANRPRKYTGFWQCLQRMTREEGWRALYAGIGAHVTRVVPNTAIMFLSYEYLVRYMTR